MVRIRVDTIVSILLHNKTLPHKFSTKNTKFIEFSLKLDSSDRSLVNFWGFCFRREVLGLKCVRDIGIIFQTELFWPYR